MRCISILFALLLAATVHAEERKKAEPQYQPFPMGVTTSDWKTAYVPGLAGNVEAIDLATGNMIWRSPCKGRPVAIDGDRIYVLSPTDPKENPMPALRLTGISIKDGGKTVFTGERFQTGLDNVWNMRASIGTKIEDGWLYVSWEWEERSPICGYQLVGSRYSGKLPDFSHKRQESMAIDLASGKHLTGEMELEKSWTPKAEHDGIKYDVATRAADGKSYGIVSCLDKKAHKFWVYQVKAESRY